jgi:hypothetical protein
MFCDVCALFCLVESTQTSGCGWSLSILRNQIPPLPALGRNDKGRGRSGWNDKGTAKKSCAVSAFSAVVRRTDPPLARCSCRNLEECISYHGDKCAPEKIHVTTRNEGDCNRQQFTSVENDPQDAKQQRGRGGAHDQQPYKG